MTEEVQGRIQRKKWASPLRLDVRQRQRKQRKRLSEFYVKLEPNEGEKPEKLVYLGN